MPTTGATLFSVTATLAVEVQPLAPVTVTRYVPAVVAAWVASVPNKVAPLVQT